jgi:hypothetical protein
LEHVFTYPSENMPKARKESLDEYTETLENLITQAAIITHVLNGLTSWCEVEQGLLRKQTAPTLAGKIAPLLKEAYGEQTGRIGWEAFLRGRVGSSWGKAYRAHYADGDDEEAQRWIGDLIRANWDLSLSLSGTDEMGWSTLLTMSKPGINSYKRYTRR